MSTLNTKPLIIPEDATEEEFAQYMVQLRTQVKRWQANHKDSLLAKKIANKINGGVGPNLYIVSYPDMRVLDLITSFPHDKEEDVRCFEREIPDMSFWSIFGDTGGLHMRQSLRDRVRNIAAKYGQSYQTTDT